MGGSIDSTGAASKDALRILLINQAWLAPELRALGHEVRTAGWVHPAFDLQFERLLSFPTLLEQLKPFQPDMAVYFDDSTSVSVLDLEHACVPTAFVSVDAHHHTSWHRGLAACFNRALVAQKDFLPAFAEFIGSSDHAPLWLPLWAPKPVVQSEQRDIPVCFRGNLDPRQHPARAAFFQRLRARVPVDADGGPYPAAYPRAKIIVNQTVAKDLNFRVFEALQCGALLITPRIRNGMEELFETGRELLLYDEDDDEQVAELIRYYLTHEEERIRIAAQGQRKVLAKHTAANRATELVRALRQLPATRPNGCHLGAAMAYLQGVLSELLRTSREPTAIDRYLNAAAKAIEESARLKERSDADFEVTVMKCVAYAREVGRSDIALRVSGVAFNAYPTNTLLRMNVCENLLRAGRAEDARRLFGLPVAPVGSSEEQTLAEQERTSLLEQAAELMRGAQQSILEQLLQAREQQCNPRPLHL
ncbi:MAG: glycosyltransferase family 1 protein [Bdellovibrionales bacterium]|nr:glycosyltransferase family 1 protein [Bdellovibrionales bacterium]